MDFTYKNPLEWVSAKAVAVLANTQM